MTENRDEQEQWRDIPDYPGYQVSDYGRIKSKARLVRTRGNGFRPIKERILVQAKISRAGHLQVSLGLANPKAVHIIVCEIFHGPKPSPHHQVAHWDGDPSNNRPSNLRWATAFENAQDTVRLGRSGRGDANPAAKLTKEKVKQIHKMLAAGMTLTKIAEEMGVVVSTIWWIKEAVTWNTTIPLPCLPPVRRGRPLGS